MSVTENHRSSQGTGFGTVALLSASHIVNDSYMNLFPPLLPFLIPALGLSISGVGWLTTCFSVTSSLSQLAIGHISDRVGGRFFIIMGPVVAAVFMSSIGLIHTYSLLAIALALAGFGVASFHPPSSAVAGSVTGNRSGRAMSIFTLGGNLGWALMPLLAVPLVARYGLSATPVLAIPGVLVALMLSRLAPPARPDRRAVEFSFAQAVKDRPLPFLALLGTVAFRSLAFFGLSTFLPKFLGDHGFAPMSIAMMLSALTFSGALGGLVGGQLSDSIGRKPVIMTSLFITVPFLYMFTSSSGTSMVVWLALAGASLLGSFSVTVVAAQEIFPNHKAIASSLALGFGLGLGGLGVGLLGTLASAIGLERTVAIITILPLIAVLFAAGLPGRPAANTNQNHIMEVDEVEHAIADR